MITEIKQLFKSNNIPTRGMVLAGYQSQPFIAVDVRTKDLYKIEQLFDKISIMIKGKASSHIIIGGLRQWI